MTATRTAVALALAAAATLLTCPPAQAAYTITPIFGPAGYTASFAFGVNDSGQVVGRATRGSAEAVDFVWDDGQVTTITETSTGSIPRPSINNAGEVVGHRRAAVSSGYHYDLATGTLTLLAFNNGFRTSPTSINDLGVIGASAFSPSGAGVIYPNYFAAPEYIGQATEVFVSDSGILAGNQGNQGFIQTGGSRTVLPTLGGRVTTVHAVNDAGQVVGSSQYNASGDYHAFVFSNGVITDLGGWQGVSDMSIAYAINNSGVAVGGDGRANNNSNGGVMFEGGEVRRLQDLIPAGSGWSLGTAYGINDRGQIVGNGNFNGRQTGFLLTPLAPAAVPEPGSLALLAAGLGLVGYARRRAAGHAVPRLRVRW